MPTRRFQRGNQSQAADQVTIGDSIGRLRFLAAVDWRSFVEAMSVVDQVLRKDPADAYAQMDFGTRNSYRQVIERIARRSGQTELQVAETALRLARDAAARTDAGDEQRARRAHLGYYLIDRGLRELERAARNRRPAAEMVRTEIGRVPLLAYPGTIAVVTAAISGYLWPIGQADGLR